MEDNNGLLNYDQAQIISNLNTLNISEKLK